MTAPLLHRGLIVCSLATLLAGAYPLGTWASSDSYQVSGWIDKAASVKLAEAVPNGAVREVRFSGSKGGTLAGALIMGRTLRDSGLRAVAAGYCLSSCTAAFLGGVDRFIDSENGPVAFLLHGAYRRDGEWDERASAELAAWVMSRVGACLTADDVARYTSTRHRNGGLYLIASPGPTLGNPPSLQAHACTGAERIIPTECAVAPDGEVFWRALMDASCAAR